MAAIPINLALDLWLLPRIGVAGAGYATAVALSVQVLALMAGIGLPRSVIAAQLRRGIDLVVQIARERNGHRRVTGIETVRA